MLSLIFGGNGFIGVNLAAHLLGQGRDVRLFHRAGADLANLAGLEYEAVAGDLLNEADLAAAFEGVAEAYNLAACGSNLKKDAAERVRVNIEAAGLVARAARQAGARLVHVSSVSAVGSPPAGTVADEDFPFNNQADHYAVTKRQGEAAVLAEVERGLAAVIVCPGNVIGRRAIKPAQKARFQAIAAGGLRFCPPGGVCLTDVDDLVAGFRLAAEKGAPGRRYILGGHNVTFRQYFGRVAQATGGKPPALTLPGPALTAAGTLAETVFGLLGREAPLDRVAARMIVRKLYFSSRRAENELGYALTDWRAAVDKAAAAIND